MKNIKAKLEEIEDDIEKLQEKDKSLFHELDLIHSKIHKIKLSIKCPLDYDVCINCGGCE